MECPFELPVKKAVTHVTEVGCKYQVQTKAGKRALAAFLTKDEADYIVQAINSYEKIQAIISRLTRNREAERLNSEATTEPRKSFWRGQAEKANEVMIWLEQALKEKP